MKTIALINQKGGTGKSTSVVNIGVGLTKLNKRVLLIDMDIQGHVTVSLGVDSSQIKNTVYQLLSRQASLDDTMITLPRYDNKLSLIPADMSLAGVEQLDSDRREYLLRDILVEQLKENFDYLIIDCPGGLSTITLMALATVREIYVPVLTEFLPIESLSDFIVVVNTTKERLNKELNITGIIPVLFDKRKILCRDVVASLNKSFGSKVFNTVIRSNVSVAEAPGYGKDIFTYKHKSNGAKDYMSLCKEIIERV